MTRSIGRPLELLGKWGSIAMNAVTVVGALAATYSVYSAFDLDFSHFDFGLASAESERFVKIYYGPDMRDHSATWNRCGLALSYAEDQRRKRAVIATKAELNLPPPDFDPITETEYLKTMADDGCSPPEVSP